MSTLIERARAMVATHPAVKAADYRAFARVVVALDAARGALWAGIGADDPNAIDDAQTALDAVLAMLDEVTAGAIVSTQHVCRDGCAVCKALAEYERAKEGI